MQNFYTLYKQKFWNLIPLLSITFLQGFWKYKKFVHWTLGSGGKKMLERSEQKKKICKKLFLPRRFWTLYEQKFSNLRPLLSTTFNLKFRKFKKFGHLISRSGGKKSVNGGRKTDYKKILLIKAKILQKQFFLRRDFTPFISESFQIWDHFFPLLFPKDSESLKFWTFKRYLKSEQTDRHKDRHTHTHIDISTQRADALKS